MPVSPKARLPRQLISIAENLLRTVAVHRALHRYCERPAPSKTLRNLIPILASAGTVALVPELAHAQSAAPVEGILDWFVGVLQGNVARSVAIIAVCFLGFLFLTGRMAWQMAFSIVIGIGIIFGAAELVDAMKSSAGGT